MVTGLILRQSLFLLVTLSGDKIAGNLKLLVKICRGQVYYADNLELLVTFRRWRFDSKAMFSLVNDTLGRLVNMQCKVASDKHTKEIQSQSNHSFLPWVWKQICSLEESKEESPIIKRWLRNISFFFFFLTIGRRPTCWKPLMLSININYMLKLSELERGICSSGMCGTKRRERRVKNRWREKSHCWNC